MQKKKIYSLIIGIVILSITLVITKGMCEEEKYTVYPADKKIELKLTTKIIIRHGEKIIKLNCPYRLPSKAGSKGSYDFYEKINQDVINDFLTQQLGPASEWVPCGEPDKKVEAASDCIKSYWDIIQEFDAMDAKGKVYKIIDVRKRDSLRTIRYFLDVTNFQKK